MKKEIVDCIFDYFYNLEFCSPCIPTEIAYDSNSHSKKDSLEKILSKKSKDEKMKYVFTIYVGEFAYQEALQKIVDLFKIKNSRKISEAMESTLCGFKVDENMTYISGTFSISPFVYALSELLKKGTNFTNFSEQNVQEIQRKLEDKIDFSSIKGNVNESFLERIFEVLKEYFDEFSSSFFEHIQVSYDLVYKEIEEMSPAISLSFYLQDLTMLRKNYDKKILDFLSLKEKERISICKDQKKLEEFLDPNNYPLGKWPSKFHPGFMQQVAINIGLHDPAPVFSVNGPPGSGKTTLVKEIIASLIVDRAEMLAQFENPDDAFLEIPISNPKNDYQSCLYKLKSPLDQFGILVASNNNNAVENITLELPVASSVKKEKTRTSFFDISEKEEIYFTDLMNALNEKEENWGMISVRLGKKANVNHFVNELWFSKESTCKYQNYLDKAPDFKVCKASFLAKLNEVKKYRTFLCQVKKEVEKKEILQKQMEKIEEELDSVTFDVNALFKKCKKIEDALNQFNTTREKYQKLIEDLNQQLFWFVRLFPFFFPKHVLLKKRKEFYEKLKDLQLDFFQKREEKICVDLEIEEKQNQKKELNRRKDNLKEKQRILDKKIEEYKEQGIVIADASFFSNISENKTSQMESPWTDSKYDELREELFFEALRVHKSFVLHSKCFKKNLSFAVNMLKNHNDYSAIKEDYFGVVLNTLFLLVPVISTTLASVERFLKEVKRDEIGYLIIDEAGQATPSSVLGSLYRSKKTIVLGDPLQIEPVVPIPEELYLALDYNDFLPASYHDVTLSAQILADFQNIYGELRVGERDIWVGCPLLLHRRCLEPMFSISNTIAYNGKMFYCTEDGLDKTKLEEENKKDIFSVSKWIDVKGEEISKENHFVPEQGEKVLDFVLQGFDKNNGEFPSLYIITPFKSVAAEIKKQLLEHIPSACSYKTTEIRNWVNTHCGTVHTFQGKEAREVIFVLGCSHNSRNAVHWVGEKPNILNVAVSRAKRKVVIIGDVSLWKDVPNFSTAYRYLNEKN